MTNYLLPLLQEKERENPISVEILPFPIPEYASYFTLQVPINDRPYYLGWLDPDYGVKWYESLNCWLVGIFHKSTPNNNLSSFVVETDKKIEVTKIAQRLIKALKSAQELFEWKQKEIGIICEDFTIRHFLLGMALSNSEIFGECNLSGLIKYVDELICEIQKG